MKKNLFYLFILLTFQLTLAQVPKGDKPDYKKIKAAIENKNSSSYYPKLMARFQDRDTTLTNEDYRNLYYGYIFQKEYDPYGMNSNEDKMNEYLKKDTLVESEYKPFIKLAEKSLEEDPFDLKTMNILSYVYELNKDKSLSIKTGHVLNKIIDVIISSGDGLTCDSAFHVITVSHEYTILSVFELGAKGQSLIGQCDYLEFEKGKYKVDGLYFDVSKLFESLKKKLGEN